MKVKCIQAINYDQSHLFRPGRSLFLDDFDVVVLSYEVGINKPNKGLFKELIKKSKVKPQEIFYSDDDETKMIGAKELEINTFLYTGFDSFIENLESLGVKISTTTSLRRWFAVILALRVSVIAYIYWLTPVVLRSNYKN